MKNKNLFLGLLLLIVGGLQLIHGISNYSPQYVNEPIVYWGGLFQVITGFIAIGFSIRLLTDKD